MDLEGLRRDTELLDAELPDPRFVDERYLQWLYHDNPHGTAYTESEDEDGVRVAHYALIPQQYRCGDGPAPFAFSLNAVTRSGIQRKGYFTTLSRRLFDRARAGGVEVIVGVSNENSTPPVVEKLDWRLYCPLPVRVVPRPLARPEGWRSADVDDHYLASEQAADDLSGLDTARVDGWTNRYTPEHLRWRLASPNGPGFTVHVGPDLVAVSTRSSFAGIPMAVLLKVLPRAGTSGVRSGALWMSETCTSPSARPLTPSSWTKQPKSITFDTFPA